MYISVHMAYKNPKVSVLIPVRDDADLLPASVESILSQSMEDFEVIIMDNGSSDGSWEVAMKYRAMDGRIRVVRNKNLGFTESLNLMIELARGKYLARLDADDTSLRDRLRIQSKTLDERGDVVMTGGKCVVVDESGFEIYRHGPDPDRVRMRWSMIFRNDFWHSAVMWRADSGFRYDRSFVYAQDYELWCRMMRGHEVLGTDDLVGIVKRRERSITSRKRESQDSFASSVSKSNMEHYLGRTISPELSEMMRSLHRGERVPEADMTYMELKEKFKVELGIKNNASMHRAEKKDDHAEDKRINKEVMEQEAIKISRKRWRESIKKAEDGRNFIWLEREERFVEVELADHEVSPAYGMSTERSPWEGTCFKKPWEYSVTAVIPCLNTPETLPICIDILRLQTVRPFIMLIDTGSTEKNLKLTEELRSEDVEVHSIRLNGVRHPSDYPAMAMDAAFSLCRTEFLFATHSDCFLRRRDLLEDFTRMCVSKSPVVGYELSPRAHEDWKGMVSHTATMYHMPTMDKIGFGWSLRRLCNGYGIVDYKPDPSKPNWPDTEILGNYILRDNKIVPHLVGGEGNQCRTLDENIDHFRSYGAAKMYSPDYYPKVLEWYHSAKREALERISEWSRS